MSEDKLTKETIDLMSQIERLPLDQRQQIMGRLQKEEMLSAMKIVTIEELQQNRVSPEDLIQTSAASEPDLTDEFLPALKARIQADSDLVGFLTLGRTRALTDDEAKELKRLLRLARDSERLISGTPRRRP